MEGWFLEPGAVPIDEFAEKRFLDRGGGRDYWSHLLSWWPHRHDANVLLLAYEEMKADLPGTVHRVADFIGIPLDQELEATALEHASLGFMTEHKDRFDDFLMRQRSELVAGLPPGSDSAKVRAGQVGSGKVELPPRIHDELARVWAEVVQPEIGLEGYATLLATLKSEKRARVSGA
jgi:hypothetical protein